MHALTILIQRPYRQQGKRISKHLQ
jgi:hypothetical protein